MKAYFIQIGKTDQGYLREGISIFERRIKHYIPLEVFTVSEVKGFANISEKQLKDSEGQKLLNSCKQGDYIILLDEKGVQYSSKQFAGILEKLMISSVKRLVFISGGAYGVSQEVHNRADAVLSFSKMTFSHQMVRLIFMEQFYRAMTILKGDPYHHG